MSIAEFLHKVNGFSALTLEGVEALSEKVSISKWAKGKRLIRRGDKGDSMFVIREGRVRVPIVDGSGREKNTVHLGPGDVVGEMALLTGEKRNADVYAESDVVAYVLERNVILPALVENPQLAKFLTEILGRRLEETGTIQWVGKYRLLGKIGEGATSKVYQGVHPTLNRVVAIKMLSHSLVYDRTFKDRFLQEARTIAGLTHPNIVQIYDTEEAWATYFIVMEKVSGTDLQKLLKEKKVMAPDEAVDILGQMSDALCYAHGAGIVHRDVKPANCAVDETGTVKLMDFGIARRIAKHPSAQKRAKIVEGTPRYLAPEAAVGRPVDGRADIYSLGIMAFEMVAGAGALLLGDDPRAAADARAKEVAEHRTHSRGSARGLGQVHQWCPDQAARGTSDRLGRDQEAPEPRARRSSPGHPERPHPAALRHLPGRPGSRGHPRIGRCRRPFGETRGRRGPAGRPRPDRWTQYGLGPATGLVLAVPRRDSVRESGVC
jgi:tRNA A-37 threonylcarbamoyl transferase component Bud32